LIVRSIPCLGRSILASGIAVRGLGRDCNCREYGGRSGDIFFIVVRQKFHSENPPRISEMADGGYHRQAIAPEYASCIRPRTGNGENLYGTPHGRHADYISQNLQKCHTLPRSALNYDHSA
jgi:hypothetical protein